MNDGLADYFVEIIDYTPTPKPPLNSQILPMIESPIPGPYAIFLGDTQVACNTCIV